MLLLSGILKEQVDRVVNCYSVNFSNIKVLNKDGWDTYKHALLQLACIYGWASGLMDIAVNATDVLVNVWNEARESQEEKQDRKNLFCVCIITLKSHNILKHDIA